MYYCSHVPGMGGVLVCAKIPSFIGNISGLTSCKWGSLDLLSVSFLPPFFPSFVRTLAVPSENIYTHTYTARGTPIG